MPQPIHRSQRLHGSIVPRGQVDSALAGDLFVLFHRYYTEVSAADFERDLMEKGWVLVLRDPAGVVRGFTTMLLFDLTFQGRRLRALFSGNTIIEHEFWGDQEMVKTWCAFTAGLKREDPSVPLYWYLIVSGFRTYLFLPLFFRNFYPQHGAATPAHERELIDTLGALKFPDEYADGVVRVSQPRECLRPELAVPDERRLRNAHVQHFLRANPGYLRGDELVCVAEFSLENTRRTAHQALVDSGAAAC